MVNRKIAKAFGLVGCLGMLAFSGCEQSSDDANSETSSTNNVSSNSVSSADSYSGNTSSDNSSNSSGGGGSGHNISEDLWGHMFDGERRETVVRVRKGTTYNIGLLCSNDGDSDTIKVLADGNTVLSYQTAENRFGGQGWYMNQHASGQNYTATSDQIVFTIETKTDSYGTWPKTLELTEVQDTPKTN